MSKALKVKDLLGSEPAELQNTLNKLREDLFKSRMRKSTNQLENVMLIRGARRDIARLNTVLAVKLRKGNESGRAASAIDTASTGQPGKEK